MKVLKSTMGVGLRRISRNKAARGKMGWQKKCIPNRSRKMSHFHDKSLNPLLSENAGPSHSDTPLQRLWRPDSSTPDECSEDDRRERHRKHFSVGQRIRRVFFVGALALGFGLLVLWLFLLLMDDTPNKMQVTQRGSESQKRMTSTTTTTTTTSLSTITKARKAPKQAQQRHQQLIHVTAPSTTKATARGSQVAEKGTRTTVPGAQSPTTIYMADTMKLSKWEKGNGGGSEKAQIVVAQMERIGGTGTAAKLTTKTLMTTEITSTKTPTWKTTLTTKAPITALTRSIERVTAESASTTSTLKDQMEDQTKSEEDEEEDNLVFWRRGYSSKHLHLRPTDSFKTKPSSSIQQDRLLTTTSPPSAEEDTQHIQQQDGYDAIRPTIQFGPMDAMEMAGKVRDRQREKEEQHKAELNEIIASLEKENSFSPVEIPFPVESPGIPIPEPVWRRPPPNETALPMLPPMKPSSGAVFTPINVHENYNAEQPHAMMAVLERKRREAPVMVTALLDIGRGGWPRFTRHFDQYLGYLANIVLRLQNRFIIYCDSLVTSYLLSLGDRINWERIQVVEMSLRELPYYKYRDEIEGIMRWEQNHWHSDWDVQMRAHPETIYAVYDILVNSKPYFLLNATSISRFSKPMKTRHQQFFVWLDAGYGHGSASEIPFGVWSPALKADKITLVQLTPKIDRVERYTLDKVYRKQKSVVSGGFLAGSAEAIKRFHTFFHKSFLEMLDEKMVDDDQTTLLVTIQKYQSDFHIVFGGWFDAFKLLPGNR